MQTKHNIFKIGIVSTIILLVYPIFTFAYFQQKTLDYSDKLYGQYILNASSTNTTTTVIGAHSTWGYPMVIYCSTKDVPNYTNPYGEIIYYDWIPIEMNAVCAAGRNLIIENFNLIGLGEAAVSNVQYYLYDRTTSTSTSDYLVSLLSLETVYAQVGSSTNDFTETCTTITQEDASGTPVVTTSCYRPTDVYQSLFIDFIVVVVVLGGLYYIILKR